MERQKSLNKKGDTNKSKERKIGEWSKNKEEKKTKQKVQKSGKHGKIENKVCQYERTCKHCFIRDHEYELSLKRKEKQLKEKIGTECKVNKVMGMEDPFYYSQKVQVMFDRDRTSTPIFGIYNAETNRVMAIEGCKLEEKVAYEVLSSIRSLLKSFRIKTYDRDSGYGVVRHVIIRRGRKTGQIMVAFVLATPIFPAKNNFVKALRKLHPEITTIIYNINDKDTTAILGNRDVVLYGKGFIEDELNGIKYRIYVKSLFPSNPSQMEEMCKKIQEILQPDPLTRMLEVNCGSGVIAMSLCNKAQEVVGLESNKDAIREAVATAKANSLKNITFYNGNVVEHLEQIRDEEEKFDSMIVSQRKGEDAFLLIQNVAKIAVKKILYISNDINRLPNDLENFRRNGYQSVEVWPIDLAPWKSHITTMVLLKQK